MTIGGADRRQTDGWNYTQTAKKIDPEVVSHDQTNLIDFSIEITRYRHCFPIVFTEVLLIAG